MCGWQREGRSKALLPCRVCGEEEETGSWCAGLWGLIEAMVLVLLLVLAMAMSHVVLASGHGSLTFRIWVIFRPRVRRVSWVSLGLSDGGALVRLFWGGGMVGGGEWVFDIFWITLGFWRVDIRADFVIFFKEPNCLFVCFSFDR